MKKGNTGDTIIDIIFYMFYIFDIITICVLGWQGKLSLYESTLFNTVLFGFVITWRRNDRK